MKKNLLLLTGLLVGIGTLGNSCSKSELPMRELQKSKSTELTDMKAYFSRSNNISGKNIEFDEKNGILKDLTSGITQDTATLKRKIEMEIADKEFAKIAGQLEIIKGR